MEFDYLWALSAFILNKPINNNGIKFCESLQSTVRKSFYFRKYLPANIFEYESYCIIGHMHVYIITVYIYIYILYWQHNDVHSMAMIETFSVLLWKVCKYNLVEKKEKKVKSIQMEANLFHLMNGVYVPLLCAMASTWVGTLTLNFDFIANVWLKTISFLSDVT